MPPGRTAEPERHPRGDNAGAAGSLTAAGIPLNYCLRMISCETGAHFSGIMLPVSCGPTGNVSSGRSLVGRGRREFAELEDTVRTQVDVLGIPVLPDRAPSVEREGEPLRQRVIILVGTDEI